MWFLTSLPSFKVILGSPWLPLKEKKTHDSPLVAKQTGRAVGNLWRLAKMQHLIIWHLNYPLVALYWKPLKIALLQIGKSVFMLLGWLETPSWGNILVGHSNLYTPTKSICSPQKRTWILEYVKWLFCIHCYVSFGGFIVRCGCFAFSGRFPVPLCQRGVHPQLSSDPKDRGVHASETCLPSQPHYRCHCFAWQGGFCCGVNESGVNWRSEQRSAPIVTKVNETDTSGETCQLHLTAAYYDFLKGPGLNHNILTPTLK